MKNEKYAEIENNLADAQHLLKNINECECEAVFALDMEDVREYQAAGIRKVKKALDLWRDVMEEEYFYMDEDELPGGKKLPAIYMQDVKVDLEISDGIGRVSINKPLPHRNTRASDLAKYSYFIEDLLEKKLGVKGEFYHVIMVFLHYYDRKRPAFVRDVDNYLEKPLIDAVSYCLIIDGDNVNALPGKMSFVVPDDWFHTDIYLIPFERFPGWVQNMKTRTLKMGKN